MGLSSPVRGSGEIVKHISKMASGGSCALSAGGGTNPLESQAVRSSVHLGLQLWVEYSLNDGLLCGLAHSDVALVVRIVHSGHH